MSNSKNAPAKGAIAIAHRDYPVPASDSFGAFLDQVDEMLSLPFLPRTDAARQGIPFTIDRIGRRTTEDPETHEAREEWSLLVTLEEACTVAQRNTGLAVTYDAGARVVIGYAQSTVRNQVIEEAQRHLERGPIEHMALREIKSKNPMHSNPIVLCNAASWSRAE